MTFLGLQGARQACATEMARYEEALARYNEADDGLEEARDALESERSVWDGSTLGTGAAVVGIIGACLLPEPFSKAVCIGGIVGGGLGAGASEIDRQSDIENAKRAVEQAELLKSMAEAQLEQATGAAFSCIIHHMAKSE